MRILLITAFITVLVGGLCVGGGLFALNQNTLEGSGIVITEDRPVDDVREVSLSGGDYHLVIAQGQESGLRIISDDNIVEQIETEMDGDRLEISYARDGLRGAWRVEPTDEVRLELTVSDLALIEVNGSGDVEADQLSGDTLTLELNGSSDVTLANLDVDALAVEVDGSGDIDADGRADTQDVEINGSGTYRAGELASRTARIDIAGSGRATVRVAEELGVEISGSGRVEYYGDPRISQDVSGSGDLIPLDDPVGQEDAATPVASPAATPRSAATPQATQPRPSTPRVTVRPTARVTVTPTPD